MIRKISKRVNVLEEYLLALLVLLILLAVFIQVIFRSVFNAPLSWTEEFSRILFIWLNLVGTSIAFRKKAHVSLDFFIGGLSKKAKLVLNIFINILIVCFLAYIFFPTIRFIDFMNSIPTAALSWPMGIFYLGIPISSVSIILSLIVDTQETLEELRKDGRDTSCQHH